MVVKVLLNSAGDDYKLTPTQCLLNVGPASSVLSSIHSVLVSTSCWCICIFFNFVFFQISYIYTFTVNTIYSTEQNKTRQYVRSLAKLKQFQTSKKKLVWTHNNHPPPYLSFFFKLISDIDRKLSTCSGGRRVRCSFETVFWQYLITKNN